MPATAGMSEMTYLRFLVYDVAGVLLWAALYVGVGIVAGESWKMASGVIGTGWAVLLALVGTGAWIAARRRRGQAVTVDTLFEPIEPIEMLDEGEDGVRAG